MNAEPLSRRRLRGAFGVDRMAAVPSLLPGAALAAAVMLAALRLADALGRGLLALQGIDPQGKPSPVSGVSVAILLGLVAGNALPLPRSIARGCASASTSCCGWASSWWASSSACSTCSSSARGAFRWS